MRIIKPVLVGLGLFVAVAFFTLRVLYTCGMLLPGQMVNGEDASWKYIDSVCDDIVSDSHIPVTIVVNQQSHNIYSVTYTVAGKEPEYTFLGWLRREPITYAVSCSVNYTKLRDILLEKYSECKSAEIVFEDGRWELNPEIIGFDFDVDKIIADMEDSGSFTLDLDVYRNLPSVTSTDLEESFNNVEWLNDFSIAYASGYKLLGSDLSDYVTDYALNVPDAYLKEFVSTATEVFNTNTGDLSVTHPVTGEAITVKKKTWGCSVNVKKEVQELRSLIESRTSIDNRIPALSGYDKIDNTYVLVSIDEQHLWYIKDGELFSETDIVTGRKGVHDTPTGAYYISECIPGKTLRGEGYATWVNKWMRLTNSGIGLHDAGWRSTFGGTVYIGNGSHGCINLPKQFAYEFYKESYVGMPVIIY